MSDSRQVHRAIKQAVKQLYPEEPRGNLARQLDTLAGLVTGIGLGKSCQLPKMARKIPGDVHPDSQVKPMSRWVQNEALTFRLYFLPFVRPLLQALAAARPLVLIMDGRGVARGGVTLMVSLIYAKRAIPIAGLGIEGTKGHFPAERPVALWREVKALVAETAPVVFLGEGEFDSPELPAEAEGYGWDYVCRTAKNIQIGVDAAGLSLEALNVKRGKREFRKPVLFTEAAYGPVMVIAWGEAKDDAPIYLVRNWTSVQAACRWYQKRRHSQTFFSDQKSRGFQLDQSHLSDPARVRRFMLAACFAYLWVIFLGPRAHQDGWLPQIHRGHRCDRSLFQLGLRLWDYLLKNDLPLPSEFSLQPESVWE